MAGGPIKIAFAVFTHWAPNRTVSKRFFEKIQCFCYVFYVDIRSKDKVYRAAGTRWLFLLQNSREAGTRWLFLLQNSREAGTRWLFLLQNSRGAALRNEMYFNYFLRTLQSISSLENMPTFA